MGKKRVNVILVLVAVFVVLALVSGMVLAQGQSGSAPGRSGENPGHGGNVPGQDGPNVPGDPGFGFPGGGNVLPPPFRGGDSGNGGNGDNNNGDNGNGTIENGNGGGPGGGGGIVPGPEWPRPSDRGVSSGQLDVPPEAPATLPQTGGTMIPLLSLGFLLTGGGIVLSKLKGF